VLTGDVTKGKVASQLADVRDKIRALRDQTRFVNDVVLFYYQGAQKKDGGRRFLLTRYNELDPDSPVEVNAVDTERLPRIPGVQVWLLNVSSEGTGDPDRDPKRAEFTDLSLKPAQAGDPAPRFLINLGDAVKQSPDGTLGEIGDRLRTQVKADVLQIVLPELLKNLQVRAP
jgi:hypothetical protein